MADTSTPAAAATDPPDPIAALSKKLDDALAMVSKANQPVYPNGHPASVFGGKPGESPNAVRYDSLGDRPYSFFKLIAAAKGIVGREKAAYELDVSAKLKSIYHHSEVGQSSANSVLAPFGVDYLTCENDKEESLVYELRQKFYADRMNSVDFDEVRAIRKALGSNVDTAGGPLLGFPAMGELVDMQRNLEVFSNAGASQVPLGPNGMMYYPKLISGATAAFIPENPAAAISNSQQTTGSLALSAKTLAIKVPISNQLLKFGLVSAEAMLRTDMAKVAALKVDSSSFDGVGGNSIKGLLTYDTQSTWVSGVDKLVAVTATTTGSDGNTLNSKDLYIMNGALPDQIGDTLTWVFRKDYWWKYLATARAGGSTTGDGQYLLSQMRTIDAGVPSARFLGNKLILSSQSPNTRKKGNGSNLVCVILGQFSDWLIGRAGVVELDANPYGDTAWGNVQTEFRLVEYVDAGPRHSASFAVCDTLLPTSFTA